MKRNVLDSIPDPSLVLSAVRPIMGLLLAFLLAPAAFAAAVVSDGSDGAFNPVGTLYTLDLPADGIFNFTSINIPSGVTVKFNRNSLNTPVYFAATGNVSVHGVIDVSATATNVIVPVANNPKQNGGPGAFDGGAGGTGTSALGANGSGSGGGGAGYSAGGAGNATAGSQATLYSSSSPGTAGPAVDFLQPLAGGSGGGGGSAVNWFGWYNGGYGGGGGGALQIATPGDILVTGDILANGANGGWAHASALAHGGAGGGGSGGNIELYAESISLEQSSFVQALGGYGGGLGTQPYSNDPAKFSSGADGGMGYLRLVADSVNLDGSIEAAVIPVPPLAWLFGSAVLALFGFCNRKQQV